MLIQQILTLLSWIAFTISATESVEPAISYRNCETVEDCRDVARCSDYYVDQHHKCEVMWSLCRRDGDCVEYGPSVLCYSHLNKCILDLICHSDEDCYKVFKCKKSKCIAEIPGIGKRCDIDSECNALQHCNDEQCEL